MVLNITGVAERIGSGGLVPSPAASLQNQEAGTQQVEDYLPQAAAPSEPAVSNPTSIRGNTIPPGGSPSPSDRSGEQQALSPQRAPARLPSPEPEVSLQGPPVARRVPPECTSIQEAQAAPHRQPEGAEASSVEVPRPSAMGRGQLAVESRRGPAAAARARAMMGSRLGPDSDRPRRSARGRVDDAATASGSREGSPEADAPRPVGRDWQARVERLRALDRGLGIGPNPRLRRQGSAIASTERPEGPAGGSALRPDPESSPSLDSSSESDDGVYQTPELREDEREENERMAAVHARGDTPMPDPDSQVGTFLSHVPFNSVNPKESGCFNKLRVKSERGRCQNIRLRIGMHVGKEGGRGFVFFKSLYFMIILLSAWLVIAYHRLLLHYC